MELANSLSQEGGPKGGTLMVVFVLLLLLPQDDTPSSLPPPPTPPDTHPLVPTPIDSAFLLYLVRPAVWEQNSERN